LREPLGDDEKALRRLLENDESASKQLICPPPGGQIVYERL